MFTTAVVAFRNHSPATSGDALHDSLKEFAFRPCSPRESRRHGWVSPVGDEYLVHEFNGMQVVMLAEEKKIVPPAAVKKRVNEVCAEREKAEGQPLSRRERQLVKEQVLEEMLPVAFSEIKHRQAIIDNVRGRIYVGASSRKAAESVLDLLRQSLGSLKVTPLATRVPPERAMTQWLNDPAERPADLMIGEDVKLLSPSDSSYLQAKSIDLDGDELRAALVAGRRVGSLELVLEGLTSFVLTDDLRITKISLDERTLHQHNGQEFEDETAKRDADAVLNADTIVKLVETLVRHCGGEVEIHDQPAAEVAV